MLNETTKAPHLSRRELQRDICTLITSKPDLLLFQHQSRRVYLLRVFNCLTTVVTGKGMLE